nr:immunoglobulin heavy chain junction region [Macaca mulatta]
CGRWATADFDYW